MKKTKTCVYIWCEPREPAILLFVRRRRGPSNDTVSIHPCNVTVRSFLLLVLFIFLILFVSFGLLFFQLFARLFLGLDRHLATMDVIFVAVHGQEWPVDVDLEVLF
jgi:hypothetical protein